MVADDGREFYGERNDYDAGRCTEFVRKVVMPQLGKQPECIYSKDGLRQAVVAWLAQFEGQGEIEICFDFAGDWTLFVDLLGEVPAGAIACDVFMQIDDLKLEEYVFQIGGIQHHALADARGNRFAYRGNRQ